MSGHHPHKIVKEFYRIEFKDVNLNSSDDVKNYLLSVGWKPTEWNYKQKNGRDVYDDRGEKIKTSPKLTEDSFDSVKGDIPKLVTRYNILKHRKSMLSNYNKKAKEWRGLINLVREDGRIPAEGIPQATNTGRYRHKKIVNIPAARAVYGMELRNLFTVPDDKVFVGIDASGLEARMQAHYVYTYPGGEEYANELIDGDIHTKNAEIFKTDRDGAKSPYYALIYGAQPKKLSETIGCSLKVAEIIWNDFWEGNPSLKSFRDDCVAEYKKHGFIVGLDGRKISCRSEHSLVNAKFQSAGSIVVKTATKYCMQWVKEAGLDAKLAIHMHDEFNAEVLPIHVDMYCMFAERAFELAGEHFNLNIPIVGECKTGKTWGEIH